MADVKKIKIKWLPVFIRIAQELPLTRKIVYDRREYNFCYVANPHNRIGFLMIWELESKRGVNFSRVKVPEGFPFVDINNDDEYKAQIPQDILLEEIDE